MQNKDKRTCKHCIFLGNIIIHTRTYNLLVCEKQNKLFAITGKYIYALDLNFALQHSHLIKVKPLQIALEYYIFNMHKTGDNNGKMFYGNSKKLY